LPSLSYADMPADDLSDGFNLTHTPLAFHTVATRDAGYFINDTRRSADPDDDQLRCRHPALHPISM
jgi:hypothetical protein